MVQPFLVTRFDTGAAVFRTFIYCPAPQSHGYGEAETEEESKMYAEQSLACKGALAHKVYKDSERKEGSIDGNVHIAEDSGNTSSVINERLEALLLFVSAITARDFIMYYCRQAGAKSQLSSSSSGLSHSPLWETTLTVGDRLSGSSIGHSKRLTNASAHIDAAIWLALNYWEVWQAYTELRAPHTWIPGPTRLLSGCTDEDDPICTRNSLNILEDALTKLEEAAVAVALPVPEPHSGVVSQGSDELLTLSYSRPRLSKQLIGSTGLRKSPMDVNQADTDTSLSRFIGSTTGSGSAKQLPVLAFETRILQAIENGRVTFCIAAPGSGKTTQVPQMILKNHQRKATKDRNTRPCKILCTQPRRLATVAAAERVAHEMGVDIGSAVGYHVRFASLPATTDNSITFCTPGTIASAFHPKYMHATSPHSNRINILEITHLLLDEVHERDLETDVLLSLVRTHISRRLALGLPCFKIVLMSATMHLNNLKEYFDGLDCPSPNIIEIPGSYYDVQEFYLEDIKSLIEVSHSPTLMGNNLLHNGDTSAYLSTELSSDLSRGLDCETGVPTGLICWLVNYAVAGNGPADRSNSGSILVFLPGYDDILAVRRSLLCDPDNALSSTSFEVMILHSLVSAQEQRLVLATNDSPSCRRIILATNIAETSLTIPNIGCVIDAGRSKEIRFDGQRRISSLVPVFASQSSLRQRAGRAGRQQNGQYFCILSKVRRGILPHNGGPAIERVDISSMILGLKAFYPLLSAYQACDTLITAPKRTRLEDALTYLQDIGAVRNNEQITPLGDLLAVMPVKPAPGKLCILGVLFGCIEPAALLAAVLNSPDPYLGASRQIRESKFRDSPKSHHSDIFAIAHLWCSWRTASENGEGANLCDARNLSSGILLRIDNTRLAILRFMQAYGLIQQSEVRSLDQDHPESDTPSSEMSALLSPQSANYPLLSALLATVANPNVAVRKSHRLFQTKCDKDVFVHATSIFFRGTEAQTLIRTRSTAAETFCFFDGTENLSIAQASGNVLTHIRRMTPVAPMALVLLSSTSAVVEKGCIVYDGWLPIVGPAHLLELACLLRDRLRHMSKSALDRLCSDAQAYGQRADRNLKDPSALFKYMQTPASQALLHIGGLLQALTQQRGVDCQSS